MQDPARAAIAAEVAKKLAAQAASIRISGPPYGGKLQQIAQIESAVALHDEAASTYKG